MQRYTCSDMAIPRECCNLCHPDNMIEEASDEMVVTMCCRVHNWLDFRKPVPDEPLVHDVRGGQVIISQPNAIIHLEETT